MFYLPLSLFNFISVLLPLHNFYHFPSSSTILLFSLLHLHLLIYSIYFSIHKYIDLLATLHRPHIDPTSTLHRPHIDPTSTPHRPHIDPTSTSHRPHTWEAKIENSQNTNSAKALKIFNVSSSLGLRKIMHSFSKPMKIQNPGSLLINCGPDKN